MLLLRTGLSWLSGLLRHGLLHRLLHGLLHGLLLHRLLLIEFIRIRRPLPLLTGLSGLLYRLLHGRLLHGRLLHGRLHRLLYRSLLLYRLLYRRLLIEFIRIR